MKLFWCEVFTYALFPRYGKAYAGARFYRHLDSHWVDGVTQ